MAQVWSQASCVGFFCRLSLICNNHWLLIGEEALLFRSSQHLIPWSDSLCRQRAGLEILTPTQAFFNIFEKTQARKNCPKNSKIFQTKTQQTVSDSSQEIRLYLVLFEQISHKTQLLFEISDSKSSKLQYFGKKTQGLWEKLKYFEKKLKLFGFKTQRTGSGQLHPLP